MNRPEPTSVEEPSASQASSIRCQPRRSAICSMAPIWHGRPKTWTRQNSLGPRPRAATRSGSSPGSLHRCRQTWGRRARRAGKLAEATKLKGEVMTSSPSAIPRARTDMCSPAVPLLHATQTCGRPARPLALEGLGEAAERRHIARQHLGDEFPLAVPDPWLGHRDAARSLRRLRWLQARHLTETARHARSASPVHPIRSARKFIHRSMAGIHRLWVSPKPAADVPGAFCRQASSPITRLCSIVSVAEGCVCA